MRTGEEVRDSTAYRVPSWERNPRIDSPNLPSPYRMSASTRGGRMPAKFVRTTRGASAFPRERLRFFPVRNADRFMAGTPKSPPPFRNARASRVLCSSTPARTSPVPRQSPRPRGGGHHLAPGAHAEGVAPAPGGGARRQAVIGGGETGAPRRFPVLDPVDQLLGVLHAKTDGERLRGHPYPPGQEHPDRIPRGVPDRQHQVPAGKFLAGGQPDRPDGPGPGFDFVDPRAEPDQGAE